MSEEANIDNLEFLYDPGVESLDIFQEDLEVANKDNPDIKDPKIEDIEGPGLKKTPTSVRPEVATEIDFLNDGPDDAEEHDEVIENDEPGDTNDTDGQDDNEDVTKQIASIGKFFAKEGILFFGENEDPEKFAWTEESFIEKFKDSAEESAWLKLEELATEALGERGVEFIENVFINKLPYTQYLESFRQQESIENLDPLKHGERIVKAYLVSRGMDEEMADEQVAISKENETLVARATKFKAELVNDVVKERENEAQRNKVHLEEIQKREQERLESYSNSLKTAVKQGEISGIPLNQKDAQSLLQFVTDKPHVLGNGQKLTDFEYKLATLRRDNPDKFLTLAKLVMNDVDLSVIKRTEETKKVEKIFEASKSKKPIPKAETTYHGLFGNLK